METLTLGRLTITASRTNVTFILPGEAAVPVTITPTQVSKLENFLKRCAPHERRDGFRVPMDSLSDEIRSKFKVRIRTVSGYLKVKPIDMSLTGMLMKSKKLSASRGAQFLTKLALDDHSCTLVSKVVRNDGNRWALHFPESIKNGELDPCEKLLCIYRILETEWLKSRVAV